MGKASYQPALWVQSFSGWITILNRFRRVVPVEDRAARFVRELESGPGTRRDLAVLQASHDYEVIGDDGNANSEVVRAAQVWFLTLANQYRVVDEIVETRFKRAPISRLFSAIVTQAHQDGADEIEIVLPDSSSGSFTVRYLIRQRWEAAMEIPSELFQALRGFSGFVRDAQYKGLEERLHGPDRLPLDLQIELVGEQAIRIALIA